MEGWQEILICDFFLPISRAELGPRFAACGFGDEQAVGSAERITFAGPVGLIEVGYERDLLANFRPTVLVRPLGAEEAKPSPYAVPIWFVIPDSAPARGYTQWDFSTEVQLREVLDRLWNKVIEPYAIPLAGDRAGLDDTLARFRESVGRSR